MATNHPTIHTRKASKVPGDTLLVLTQPARDASGRWWPAGTNLNPSSAGYDNTERRNWQRVTIGRETVVFYEEA